MKIRIVGPQPHCFRFGGFDYQMVRIQDLIKNDLDYEPLCYWSRDEKFDVLHLWGCNSANLDLARMAKANGKTLVLSPLLPYISPRSILALSVGRYKLMRELLSISDRIIVVNELQEKSACALMGADSKKVCIIPTVIEDCFFQQTNETADNYVLCVGNIQDRKNQINLALACIKMGLKSVFIGNKIDADDCYCKKFETLVQANPKMVIWNKSVSSSDLLRYTRSAKVVALPSFSECQPASILEGVALGRPVVVANMPYAKQSFYNNSIKVNPRSLGSLIDGLTSACGRGAHPDYTTNQIHRCRSSLARAKFIELFQSTCK